MNTMTPRLTVNLMAIEIRDTLSNRESDEHQEPPWTRTKSVPKKTDEPRPVDALKPQEHSGPWNIYQYINGRG